MQFEPLAPGTSGDARAAAAPDTAFSFRVRGRAFSRFGDIAAKCAMKRAPPSRKRALRPNTFKCCSRARSKSKTDDMAPSAWTHPRCSAFRKSWRARRYRTRLMRARSRLPSSCRRRSFARYCPPTSSSLKAYSACCSNETEATPCRLGFERRVRYSLYRRHAREKLSRRWTRLCTCKHSDFRAGDRGRALRARGQIAREVSFQPDEILFSEGHPSSIVLVLSGSVALESPAGGESANASAGDCLGAEETLAGSDWSWRARRRRRPARRSASIAKLLFELLADHMDLLQGIFGAIFRER